MKRKIFIIIIIMLTQLLTINLHAKTGLKATFLMKNPNCNSCCISAIKILTKKFLEDDRKFKINNIEVFVNKKNKHIKNLLGSESNIINVSSLNKDTLKEMNMLHNENSLILSDSLNRIYYIFSVITNTSEIVRTINSFNNKHEYMLTKNEFNIGNILSPILLKDNLIFIEPESDIIWGYNIDNQNLYKYPEPSKDTKFSLYDSTKNELAIWDMTYEYYQSFIKNYFVFSSNEDIYSFISILKEYELIIESSKKEAAWQSTLALMNLKQNNKVKPLYQLNKNEWISSKFTRLYSIVNDSIYIIPFYDDTGKIYFRFFNTSNFEFLNRIIFKHDIAPCNIDSTLFVSDGNNNIFFYDYNKNKLVRFMFSMNEVIKDTNNFEVKHTTDTPVYEIVANKSHIYFLYYTIENNIKLYIEEFHNNSMFNFNRSFVCNSNNEYLETNLIIGIRNNFLYVLSQNEDNEWLLERFEL